MIDDRDALLWNHTPPKAAPVLKPRTVLWTLRQGSRAITASLLGHGEYGWELQLAERGEVWYGHRHPTHAEALAAADQVRAELEPLGWAPDPSSVL